MIYLIDDPVDTSFNILSHSLKAINGIQIEVIQL